MTLDQFWNIVDRVHQASGGDMEKKCELLELELRRLSLDELLSFHAHFTDCRYRAYSWPLCAIWPHQGSHLARPEFRSPYEQAASVTNAEAPGRPRLVPT